MRKWNWDTIVRRGALGIVIISTTVLSYATLRSRAEHSGFELWTTWFYPLCLDFFILGASRVWQNQLMRRRTRTLAALITLGAIGAAIAAFAVEFGPRGWDAVAFAAVVPVSLACALILTSWAAADRKAAAEAAGDDLSEDDLLGEIAASFAAPADSPADPGRLPQVGTDDGPGYGPVTVVNDSANGANGAAVRVFRFTDSIQAPPEYASSPAFAPAPAVRDYIDQYVEKELVEDDVPDRQTIAESAIDDKKEWVREYYKKNNVMPRGVQVDNAFDDDSRNGSRIVRAVKKELGIV